VRHLLLEGAYVCIASKGVPDDQKYIGPQHGDASSRSVGAGSDADAPRNASGPSCQGAESPDDALVDVGAAKPRFL